MNPLGVVQVVDSLDMGGAERVAVNISNHLARNHYRSYLCTTRHEGPLEDLVMPAVTRLRLRRRITADVFRHRTLCPVSAGRAHRRGTCACHSFVLCPGGRPGGPVARYLARSLRPLGL